MREAVDRLLLLGDAAVVAREEKRFEELESRLEALEEGFRTVDEVRSRLPVEFRIVVAVLVVVVAAAVGVSMARDGDEETNRPYIDERGIWMPEYFEVKDSTDTVVGVARSTEAFGLDSVRPYPVWSADEKTQQAGWVRWRGYWPPGEPEPWCRECLSISTSEGINGRRVVTERFGPNYAIIRIHETFDRYGNKLSSRAEVIHRPMPTPIPPVAQ